MINNYSKFYAGFFQRSGGYMPFWPFLSNVQLGDILLVLNGKMVKIGNVLDSYFGVYEEVIIEKDWQAYKDSCLIQSGVNQIFSPKKDVKDSSTASNQSAIKLEFNSSGDYIFHTPKIRTKRIENFYEFKFKLLQFLASEKFNFKELLVVTSVAKIDLFSLIIARINKANTEIVIEGGDQKIALFEDLNKENNDSDISCLESVVSSYLRKDGGESFFKAQKLEVSSKGKMLVDKYINANLPESMQKYKDNILQFVPTQVLPSIDIYPAKVHDLFHFREMNMDDFFNFLGEY